MWPNKIGHIGSWGLPELGISEAVGGLFNRPQTIQGGSNIWQGPAAQAPLVSPIPSTPGPIGYNVPASQPQFQPQVAAPQPQQPQDTGGGDISAGDLQSLFGFGDPNVINAILGSPGERARYAREKSMRGQASSGANDIMGQVEAAYGPAISALGNIETSARTGSQESLDRMLKDYNSYLADLAGEETTLKAGQAEQERLVGESGRSAAEEARRNFNSLKQQGMSRFGAGSSTGPAVGEIAAQEFARTQGRLGQAGIAAQQQLGLEAGRLNTFISQKKNDLLRWKLGSEDQIRQNLTATLQNIDLRRGELESAKGQAKINVINQAKAELERINSQFYNTRAALALSAIQNGQQIAQRVFTPQEQASIWNQVFAQQLTGVGTGITPQMAAPILGGRKTDAYGNLINPFGAP